MFLEISWQFRFFWHARKYSSFPEFTGREFRNYRNRNVKSSFLSVFQILHFSIVNSILTCSRCCKKKIDPVASAHVSTNHLFLFQGRSWKVTCFSKLFCVFRPWTVLFSTMETYFYSLWQPNHHCWISWTSFSKYHTAVSVESMTHHIGKKKTNKLRNTSISTSLQTWSSSQCSRPLLISDFTGDWHSLYLCTNPTILCFA